MAVERVGRSATPAGTNGRAVRRGRGEGLGLAAAMAVAAASLGVPDAGAAESGCTVGKRIDGMCFTAGLHSNLPVVSNGKRFTSQPFGESQTILDIARTVKRNGTLTYQRVPALRISGRAPLRATGRYDYRFPESCGGYHFSYLESEGLRALGLHRGSQLVVDVLEGGGSFSGPRLWGVNDQVLNESIPMKFVAGDGDEGGLGLHSHSYAIGYVTMLPDEKKQTYGDAYAAATRQARQCLEVFGSDLATAD